jgi:hypothetical protein
MSPFDEVRGRRLGLVRRLLAAFEGKDLPAPVYAARLDRDKKAVYRYERGEILPPQGTVDKIVEMCVAAGLPMITAEWIERGRGGAAALGELRVPDSALVPTMEATEKFPAADTPRRRIRTPRKTRRVSGE